MVIGVDAGALSVSDGRLKVGVYRVMQETLRALACIDKENEYRLYSFGEIGEIKGLRSIEIRLPKIGWGSVWLPVSLRRSPVDVFLGFAQALPSSKTSYNIGFIYDLGFLYHPEAYGPSAKILKRHTDGLIRRADHIITISLATKADIVKEYRVSGEKITVAYPGVGPSFSAAGEKHIGKRAYVLFVGSLNKAKDIPTLLRLAAPSAFDIYLIGGDYWPDPEIDETIEKLHLGDRVKKLGVVTDAKLAQYYRGAAAFVTTALREGFCLPAAEAMACGTPVVALGRGALAEVVGKGGIVVRSLRDFASAVNTIPDGNTRNVLAKNAVEQAKKYRWEAFAKQILQRIHEYKTA